MISTKIFEIIWAVGAILLGGSTLLFTDWYVGHIIKWSLKFFNKTKISFYKLQAEEMKKPYMKILSKIIGFLFLLLGVTLLLGGWHIG